MSGRNVGPFTKHDSVRLNSGGPEMAVVGTMPRDTSTWPYPVDCMCSWLDGETLAYGVFPDVCLEHVHHCIEFSETSQSEYQISGVNEDGEKDGEATTFYGSNGGIYLSDSPIDVLNPDPKDLLWDARGIFWRIGEEDVTGSLHVRLRATEYDQVVAMLQRKHSAVLLWNYNEVGVAFQTDSFEVENIGGGINTQMLTLSLGCTFKCQNVQTYIVEKEDVEG